MTPKAAGTAILGLLIVLAASRSSQARQSKPGQPALPASRKENADHEPPEKAVRRLIEGLREHPVKRSAVEGLGRIYAIDVETGQATLVADESVRGLDARPHDPLFAMTPLHRAIGITSPKSPMPSDGGSTRPV